MAVIDPAREDSRKIAATSNSATVPIRYGVSSPDELDAVYKYVAQNYGPQMVAMLADPEIRGVFMRAYREGWVTVPERVTLALQGTNAYRNSTPAQRNWDMLTQTNPAEAQRQITTFSQQLQRYAGRLGVDVGIDAIDAISKDALRNGWTNDEARIKELLVGFWSASSPGTGKGTLAGDVNKIRRAFKKYGLPVSDESLMGYAKELELGTLDPDALDEMILMQAKARYPQFANLIDRGMTPDEITAPYRQILGGELEVDPNQIDFADPKWSDVMDGVANGRPMTLTEAARWARKQDAWRYTDKANRQAADLEMFVMKAFGKVA